MTASQPNCFRQYLTIKADSYLADVILTEMQVFPDYRKLNFPIQLAIINLNHIREERNKYTRYDVSTTYNSLDNRYFN